MKVLRPIGHEERLSIVDHLDELRSRLLICGGVMLVVFCVCFWQNQALIRVLNRALPSQASRHGLAAQTKQAVATHDAFIQIERGAQELAAALSRTHGVPPQAAQGLDQISAGAAKAAQIGRAHV